MQQTSVKSQEKTVEENKTDTLEEKTSLAYRERMCERNVARRCREKEKIQHF